MNSVKSSSFIYQPRTIIANFFFKSDLFALGLEPEIQRLISKHKQELNKLRSLHEAELLQADERAAQRFIQQTEELRERLQRERDEECERERENAKHR